jgi:hypothetical protein
MATTVYKLFMMKPLEAWYQLSEEEKASLFKKVGESFKNAGG